MKTLSSRDFNNDVGGAKRAASNEPVFITDRGEPSYVLLSIQQFRAMTNTGETAFEEAERINAACPTNFDWEPPRMMTALPQAADFGE